MPEKNWKKEFKLSKKKYEKPNEQPYLFKYGLFFLYLNKYIKILIRGDNDDTW